MDLSLTVVVNILLGLLTVTAAFSASLRTPSPSPGANEYECAGSRLCRNISTGEKFNCRKRLPNIECCSNGTDGVEMFYVTRQTSCCPGSGIFDEQTHKCTKKGAIRLRKEAVLCPSTHNVNVYYNTESQKCCTDSRNVTRVYLKNDRFSCCGNDYIRSEEGCCAEKRYVRTTHCCRNDSEVVPRRECEELPNAIPSAACGQEIVCHQSDTEQRFEIFKNKPSYVYLFQIHEQSSVIFRRSVTYRIISFGQFTGKGNKLKPVTLKKPMKISVPKCKCPGTLKYGQTYLLMTRSKVERKHLKLRGDKYFLKALDVSDILAQFFDL